MLLIDVDYQKICTERKERNMYVYINEYMRICMNMCEYV